jgi:hypothetical protein
VVVAEFRDVVYPGLVSTGTVERGGSKPYHTVINGENYHVLKALTYTHRGKVDAIQSATTVSTETTIAGHWRDQKSRPGPWAVGRA